MGKLRFYSQALDFSQGTFDLWTKTDKRKMSIHFAHVTYEEQRLKPSPADGSAPLCLGNGITGHKQQTGS